MNHATTGKRDWDEADIGSGEKSPGQHETEEMIRQIPRLPDNNPGSEPPTAGNGLPAQH
jgi:hypothetical protein